MIYYRLKYKHADKYMGNTNRSHFMYSDQRIADYLKRFPHKYPTKEYILEQHHEAYNTPQAKAAVYTDLKGIKRIMKMSKNEPFSVSFSPPYIIPEYLPEPDTFSNYIVEADDCGKITYIELSDI